MNELKQLAETLKNAGTVCIPKDSIHEEVLAMAKTIYNCPRRNSTGRSPQEVYRDCSFVSIEHALAKVIGGKKNPLKFDERNPESYKYDVIKDDKLFETKRHKLGSTYFSYKKKSLKTYLKHCTELDYLVTAYVDDTSDTYKVTFAMICNSKTFEYYYKPSNYAGQNDYYDHHTAQRQGDCVAFGLRNSYY